MVALRRSRKPAVGQFYLFERFRRYDMSREEWEALANFAADRLARHGLPLDVGIDAVTDAVLYAVDHYREGSAAAFKTYAIGKLKWALVDVTREHADRDDALDHAVPVGVGLDTFDGGNWTDREWFADADEAA